MVVAQMHIHVKMYYTVHFKYVYFIVWQGCLNKDVEDSDYVNVLSIIHLFTICGFSCTQTYASMHTHIASQ